MVNQEDLDQLQAELEHLRNRLISKREDAALAVEEAISKADSLLEQSRGGKFEPAVTIVCDMLGALQRGVDAQKSLNEAYQMNT